MLAMKRLAVLVLATAALAAAGPVSAVDAADYVVWRVNSPDARGLVVLSYSGTTTVNAGVLGLAASQEYSVIGRTINCSGTPAPSNRAFGLKRMTDLNGNLFFKAQVSPSAPVQSLWLGSNDALAACVPSRTYDRLELVGDWNGDADISMIWDKEHVLSLVFAERRPNGMTRVTVVLRNQDGEVEDWLVRGVNRGCGKTPTNSFFDLFYTDYKSKSVEMTQTQFDSIRSVRIKNLETGRTWCAPSIIVANTWGD